MAGTRYTVVAFLIAIGFLANAFQVTCNCSIGVTRIMVQMSNDGCLPKWLGVVNPKRHAPVNAHWAYFVASVPVIIGYSFLANWSQYTLGVTFGCGYVFMLSAFAAAKLTSPGMASFWKSSEIHRFPGWLIKAVGLGGGVIAASMVAAYLVLPQLGITGNLPYLIVVGIIFGCYIIIVRARSHSPLLNQRLKSVPVDESGFFEDLNRSEESGS
jgi:amino acid transporter